MSERSPPPRKFSPVYAESATCKCCGGAAERYGVVDFHKSCEDVETPVLAPSGIDIWYHRCGNCGFIFTVAFDNLSHDDFQRFVYNDEYVVVDPHFVDFRPRHNAQLISTLFPAHASLRILDYGGGTGLMSELLRAQGFEQVTTYDPFYAGNEARPAGQFDLVTCFEVLEHTPTPLETLRDIRRFVDERGMVLFSTLMQPANMADLRLTWRYAAPRNGHVSLYSREAMTALMKQLGLRWTSQNDVLHIAYRGKPPRFAAHLVKR